MNEHLLGQMAMLDPVKFEFENPRFGEKKLFKWWKRISNKLNKLLAAVDTFSASKADSERGLSAINNTVNKLNNYKQCCQPSVCYYCGTPK